ncbi:MAG: family 43 glycosylhydrolase [Planctomycetes bacterium]|nr:family 43 glycosylhydrolase [Planctomycetota bacterium]
MIHRGAVLLLLHTVLTFRLDASEEAPQPPVFHPAIEGQWWPVSGDPDLGPYTTEKQQPVDFAVWQAADGTWQLWSCIRHTGCGGHTRLFYRWEGQRLTDRDWKPIGIAQQARTDLGESLGGLQAPHVVRWRGKFYMAYGDWEHICLSQSDDGKQFTPIVGPDGKTGMFTEGLGCNTRDAMLLDAGGLWHCYYTAFPNQQGAVFCRISRDLRSWGDSVTVAFGGRTGTNAFSAECPHVAKFSGRYYLFRTQRYGTGMHTSIYHSIDPLMFGINQDDRYYLTALPVAAPEIILHEGKHYIASLMGSLKGIQIARLEWRAPSEVETANAAEAERVKR